MNSMNSSAEAGQPKQNKNPPNADDPSLDPGRDCELPMLLRMTLPNPKKLIRRSSLRGNLQLRFLCHCGGWRLPKGVDNRNRQTKKQCCDVKAILMFCSSLPDEAREDRHYDGKATNL